jgi:hypothetical protein
MLPIHLPLYMEECFGSVFQRKGASRLYSLLYLCIHVQQI